MNILKLPEGNGQEVYIDPEWITDPECGFFFFGGDIDTPERMKKRQLVDNLIDLGYEIITDSSIASDDTFFFTPCLDKHINKNILDYKEKKNKKIQESLKEECFSIPQNLDFPKDEFPTIIPALPFVLKNINKNGGIDKILISTKEQLDIFMKFYEEINDYSFKEAIKKAKRQWNLGEDVIFYEDGSSNSYIGISRIDYKKRLHEDFIMQNFIETPTEYNTSLRVVASSSGDIFGASLKYAYPEMMEKEGFYGLVDRYLQDPESPYYLGSKSIISNTVAGGNSILLGKSNYSIEEQEILKAHGIDPYNASVPEKVEKAALSIMRNCHREIGAISGIDFIYDKKTKTWKYLEEQEYPMMNTYCEKFNLPYTPDKDKLGEYIETQFNADINARLRALALTVLKKQKLENSEKVIIKK